MRSSSLQWAWVSMMLRSVPIRSVSPGAVKGECHAASIRVGISAMTPTLPDQLEPVVFERTPKTQAVSERSWPQSIGTLG